MIQKRFIAWFLVSVAILIIAMPSIPHHHHDDMYAICLKTNVLSFDSQQQNTCCESCTCDSNTCQSQSNNKTCSHECITHIHATNSGLNKYIHIEPFVFQLFNIQVSEFVLSFLSQDQDKTLPFGESCGKAYLQPLLKNSGRRAPPFYNV